MLDTSSFSFSGAFAMRHVLFALGLFAASLQAADPLSLDVYRDPNCGCCKAWIADLRAHGLTVNDHEESDMSGVKARLGVPSNLVSCHTGVIGGRFVEGHVPAADILALQDQPDLRGIAVPGMPAGAPGMNAGGRQDPYQVIGVDAQGQERVMARYP